MFVWIIGFGFLVGICLGSFTKALADRSIGKVSFWGRSYCPKCRVTLKWYDLFPIFSYLSINGKCRYCHKKISLEYPLTEAILGVLGALIFAKFFPFNFYLLNPASQSLVILDILFKLFTVCVLSTIFITDFKTGYIYDRISYPAIAVAFSYLILEFFYQVLLNYLSLKSSTLGPYLLQTPFFKNQLLSLASPLIGSLVMAILLALFFGGLIFITKGRGMGGGDLKLGIFMGLSLGFPNAITALILSFILGSAFGVGLILFKLKKLTQTIPFGPFLSFGSVLSLLFGSQILSWYINFHLF